MDKLADAVSRVEALPMPLEISTPLPLSISYSQENFNSPTPVLQDASTRANIISPSVGEYTISSEELNLAMHGCRSRRNLAAWLAGRVFTMREIIGSKKRTYVKYSPSAESVPQTFFHGHSAD